MSEWPIKFEFEKNDVIVRFGYKARWMVDFRAADGYHVRRVLDNGHGLGIYLEYVELDECHDNYIKVGKWDIYEGREADDDGDGK